MLTDLTKVKSTLSSQIGSKRNLHSLPRLTKTVINYRISDVRDSQEGIETARQEILAITGQYPRLCKSKKAVSSFKLRVNEPLAFKVTLRGNRMYEFVEKLFNLVLPRLRDFKGMPLDSFDAQGNYSMVIKDQTYFPEIDLDKINRIRPIQITFVINGSSQEESKMLLSALGFPFAKND